MRRFCSSSILFLLICGASLLSAKSSSLSLVLPFSFFFFCFSDLRRHYIVSTIVALVVLFVLDVSVMNKLSLSLLIRRQYSPSFFFFCLQPGFPLCLGYLYMYVHICPFFCFVLRECHARKHAHPHSLWMHVSYVLWMHVSIHMKGTVLTRKGKAKRTGTRKRNRSTYIHMTLTALHSTKPLL